jgi:hypothetical protein
MDKHYWNASEISPLNWPYGLESELLAAFRRRRLQQQIIVYPIVIDIDPADDGPEVEIILRRTQSFYDRILMAADDARIREHCRIRNIEHEFCKKVGTL